jgi:hypothetical protein
LAVVVGLISIALAFVVLAFPGLALLTLVFLLALALLINPTYGPSRISIDSYIERRFPRWARLAEFRRSAPPLEGTRKAPTEPTPTS